MMDHNHDCIVNDHSPAYHMGHHEGNDFDLSTALGLNSGDGHSVLGHILGTDSCGQVAHVDNHGHNGPVDSYGATDPAHVNTLETMGGLNWSHAFTGFKFSRNIMFMCIFCSMALWLMVISFIRHNEPVINQALGMGTGAAPAQVIPAQTDQALLDGTRHAMPIPTPMTTATQATLGISPQYYTQVNAAPNSVPAGQVAAATQATVSQPAQQTFYIQSGYTTPVQPGQQASQAYHVPMQAGANVRLKTIVTR